VTDPVTAGKRCDHPLVDATALAVFDVLVQMFPRLVWSWKLAEARIIGLGSSANSGMKSG
jgi:hypothetical protein